MKPNPDDRRDNVKKIQRNINRTIQNMEAADEMPTEICLFEIFSEMTRP